MSGHHEFTQNDFNNPNGETIEQQNNGKSISKTRQVPNQPNFGLGSRFSNEHTIEMDAQ
jgi:hypothetical protein